MPILAACFDRIGQLAELFAIDVLAYAIISNHYHIVVRLRPERAAMAKTPEESDYTSIQARIQLKEPIRLALFRDQVPQAHRDDAITFYLPDYLQLMDWSGRAIAPKKRGKIDDKLPTILERFGFDEGSWQQSMMLFQKPFPMIGGPDQVRLAANKLSRHWFRGLGEMGFLANA